MTTGIISQSASLAGLTNIVNTKVSNDASADFSEALKASSEKQNSVNTTQIGASKESDKSQKKLDADTANSKEETKTGEDIKKTDDSSKVVEDTAKTEEDEIPEEVMETVATAIQAVADILNVDVAVVDEALDSLGLTDISILDESKIQDIALEIEGVDNPVELMTNEQLYTDVKAVTEAVGEIVGELQEELDIPQEDIKDTIQRFAANQEAVQIDEEAVKTQMPAVDAKNDADNETASDEAGAQSQMNWTESVVDNIKEAAGSISETETVYQTDMEQIYEQVIESLKLNLTKDVTEMEINLHPASLGNVRIQVAAKDGMITANFTTQNEQVKAAIETQIVQLKESMNEQGIKVEAIEVNVAAHAFEENLSKEGERSNGSEAETKRKRRSINLNEIDENDDIDIVEDEIKIAREMMMHNGTTVDYMA